MEWVKLAAVPAYYVDGALLRAGEAAEVLFCRALAHCGSVESVGRVDKTVLPMLTPTKAQARADALVREGLWLDEGSHYLIRSWDKWQDQHDVAAEKRRQDRERQREKRRREREQNQQKRDGHTDPSSDLSRDSHGTSRDSHGVEGEGEGEGEKNTARPPAAAPDGFESFWAAYPHKVAKQAAVKAYRAALKKTSAGAILAGAERYRDDPTRDPAYTAHPASWLNAGRWEDEGPARPGNVRSLPSRQMPAGADPHKAHLWEQG